MTEKTAPNLRQQIIDSLLGRYKDAGDLLKQGVEELVDEGVMPVLTKAMAAGELLVSRNTGRRIPVPEAIHNWVKGMQACGEAVRRQEATVSKRTLLLMIYKLADNAQQALNDIENAS